MDVSGLVQVTHTDVSGLVQVTHTDVSGLAQVTQTDVSGLAQVTHTDVSGLAQVTQMDVSGLAQVTQTDVSGLAQVTHTDESGLAQVTQMDVSGLVQVTQTDVSGLAQVTQTNVSGLAQVTQTDVSGLTRPVNGRGRKRLRNEHQWKRTVAKRSRGQGKTYISLMTGKQQLARLIRPGCGHSCRYKCHEKFSLNDRESIFHSFWQLGEVSKQWQYVGTYAKQKPKQVQKSSGGNRKVSIQWSLPKQGTGPEKVCKTFFLHTLDISETVIKTAYRKLGMLGVSEKDMRGKHRNRPNTVSCDAKDRVRQHIESFQCVDSHYCRKDTSKRYLPAQLNVKKMYQLYKEQCQQEDLSPVHISMYRKIFDCEYNLSFHKPIKDRCDFCVSVENAGPDVKQAQQGEYNRHINNKIKSRQSKVDDKEKAKTDHDLCVACFDLEQVLLTPHSNESCLYYKRKLSSFNFTIYDLCTKDGYCYIWNEVISGRGACEIASCVLDFIKAKRKKGIKHFIFYSDNCSSQNKNKYYITMLWHSLQSLGISTIQHKYLIKGHTQNEADSIHACVEAASRKISIYTTAQWSAVVRTARREQPYIVKEMGPTDFFDFKAISVQLKNFHLNENNEKVDWHSIQLLKLNSESPNKFDYQTDYDGLVKSVDLFKRLRSSCGDVPNPCQIMLSVLHTELIPLGRDKYVDLVHLCSKGIIPRVHHPFYLLLPHQ
ncbi:uncharacterized protein LOC127833824 isoform X1 [Dreissena polymorpha]|uniref:uncharacterized protein LOC127833824 isoform X1 n=1 Tax=Dreissena polymorpha TaxID=45954 RepID=UPI002263EF3C|nr:uncharacterized protein LOC127833824 isoform X1 [Dreissena polymorpha]